MDALISIIVPVYNVEAYLRQCVDSILEQTFPDMEVILVDDGSEDNCPEICDGYAAKDKRVRVIHKKNGGLSDARNAGMAYATGEYLMFVDGDDQLPLNAVQKLFQIAHWERADIVIGNHARFVDSPMENPDLNIGHKVITPIEAMRDALNNGCASWARLYRSEIHKELLFPCGQINEDEAIVLAVLNNCHRVAVTNDIVYYYRCRSDSITTSAFSLRKLDWVKHCRENLFYIQKNYPQLEQDAAARYRSSLLWALTEMALSNNDFRLQTGQLLKELKANRRLFARIPYRYGTDRIRTWILTWLPFGIYRALIRIKRKHRGEA